MDIASLLEVEVKEGKPSDLHSNGEIADYQNIPDFSIRVSALGDVVAYDAKSSPTISHDERHYYKLMFGADIASVRFRKLHCTACDVHIGSAPAEAHNMHEHPILHVLLCTSCRNFYGDGTFEQGDDATDMFCRWCANGGNLYCCSYCSNTFCYACIKRNFDPLVRKKIERDEKWKCFVCNPADLYSARASCWALLQHVQTVTRILQSDRKMTAEEIDAKMNLDESQCCPHKSKRKRADTPTDDEEEDETYTTAPKRKRRRLMNARRAKRRQIKLEMGEQEGSNADPENPRQPNSNHVNAEEVYFVNTGRNSRQSNDKTPDELPPLTRQTRRRLRSRSSNRTTEAETSKFSVHDDDIPAPLLQCDQSMVEGAESLSFGAISPGSRGAASSASRMGITPVPTAHLLKRPVAGPATRGGRDQRIVRNNAPFFVRKFSNVVPPNVSQVSNNAKTTGVQSMPMVSIPSRNHMPQSPNRINVIQQPLQNPGLVRNPAGLLRQIRPRIVLAKPIPNPNIASRTPSTQPPSVIDLESDEEVPAPVSDAQNELRTQDSNDRVPELSTTTYPVRPDDGLLTILSPTPKSDGERSDNEEEGEEADRRPKESAKASGPSKSIEVVLDTLKNKLKKVLEPAMIFTPDQELVAAKAKTRAVNRTIKRTVAELTSLSDNLVTAYRAYKRQCNKEGAAHTPRVTLEKKEKSHKSTPLDMLCTRESEPESEAPSSDDDSDDSIRPVREMRPFGTRVHCGVEAKPETEDKAIQIYDVVMTDYEKSVGYALLLKADYDPKRERDILRPVMVPDQHFGKYEEQFIDYLQYLEDRRNASEDEEDLASVSINDLVEADIPTLTPVAEDRAPEMSEKNAEEEKETAVEEGNEKNDENVEILDEHLEISITTTATHSSSSDSDSDSTSSNSETGTSEAGSPRKKKTKEKPKEEEKEGEKQTMEVEESERKEAEECEEKKEEATEESKEPKQRTGATDEETVLAVRALIEEDSGENSNSNAALNSWKPVESDDECTVLD